MKNFIIFFLLLFINQLSFAGGSPTLAWQKQGVLHPTDWSFKENKGQLLDENRKPLPEIKYYGQQGGVSVYCKAGMIAFVFVKVETKGDSDIHRNDGGVVGRHAEFISASHRTTDPLATGNSQLITCSRTELIFQNANPNAEITATEQQQYYENYYTTGDADHGITDVHTFKMVTYKDIYPNIDLILHSKERGMKYEFLVRVGGKVSDIQMVWKGLDSLSILENGGMRYSNRFGEIEESKPECFMKGDRVASSFNLEEGILAFSIEEYDKTNDLIIDPALVWGTDYGGDDDNWPEDLETDKQNNIVITGTTSSKSGIATKGAYQTSNIGTSGEDDAFVAKFNEKDSLLWATYYGGNLSEIGSGIAIDKDNNICITGQTGSKSGIATTNAYQTIYKGPTFNGSYWWGDAFVAKFSNSGLLVWATYYGGDEGDIGAGIAIDNNKNIYITGNTKSYSGIATTGSHKAQGDSIKSDAFVAKFTDSGSLAWGTYYGGNEIDYGKAIVTDISNNVYITGYTYSDNGIASYSSQQTKYAGNTDAFLTKFNNSGSLLWGTYFGGNHQDLGINLAIDRLNKIYITGFTGSQGIATPNTHKIVCGSSGNAFIGKFSDSGRLEVCTYYGGDSGEWANGIAVDTNNRIYITGLTYSESGVATKDGYLTKYQGSQKTGGRVIFDWGGDAFIAKFDSKCNLIWGSYYGGDSADIGNGVKVDKNNNVIVLGMTMNDSGLATSGTYQQRTKHSPVSEMFDAFLIKLSIPDGVGIITADVSTNQINIKPNPFSCLAMIEYVLEKKSVVNISVTDLSGKQITSLFEGEQNQGTYELQFDPLNFNYDRGIYLLNIRINSQETTKKILFLKN